MSTRHLTRGVSAGAIALAMLGAAQAQTALPDIRIGAARPAPSGPGAGVGAPVQAPPPAETDADADATIIDRKEIVAERPTAADTVKLLENAPGVSWYEGGGVSRLPAIHGMADDRLKIMVGGVEPTSACANHMNPPLSYIDPNNVDRIEVQSGVMPVSKGGDSIGGSILVTPRQPVFAPPANAPAVVVTPTGPFLLGSPYPPFLPFNGQGLRFGAQNQILATGAISAFFRTNNNGITVSGTANVATDHWSLLYNGAWSRATDYHAGGGGEKVLSTNFISEQHLATVAY
jgi:iron complex outermembrane receptor protein